MKRYEAELKEEGYETLYLEYDAKKDSLLRHLKKIKKASASADKKIVTSDPVDFILEKRLERYCEKLKLPLEFLDNPQFINQTEENQAYRDGKKRWYMADFYKVQRRKLDLLMAGDEPVGGKWSFDEENRKKVPKNMLLEIPSIPPVKRDEIDEEAQSYVEKRFGENLGSIDELYYPTDHATSKSWLKKFLKNKFENFGAYEDAIEEGQSWLWHSVLTPMLNIGLLTPTQVVKETMKFVDKNDVPLNSVEGFIRQIIGWREFMRATYEDVGVEMRTTNHWEHHRKIPDSFYDGTTGILPVDDAIQRLLKTGYCHHIERLMVLGGFMFLCEFDPDDIYLWFMEMFIDSYDWVMVPNAYSMSQHADGGLITTKPYFSGSSYVRKMSHYKKGDWCDVWDGLYWRWIWLHRDSLAKNPRWAMMCSMVKKMDEAKLEAHLKNAKDYLKSL